MAYVPFGAACNHVVDPVQACWDVAGLACQGDHWGPAGASRRAPLGAGAVPACADRPYAAATGAAAARCCCAAARPRRACDWAWAGPAPAPARGSAAAHSRAADCKGCAVSAAAQGSA